LINYCPCGALKKLFEVVRTWGRSPNVWEGWKEEAVFVPLNPFDYKADAFFYLKSSCSDWNVVLQFYKSKNALSASSSA
jgi:hypothetical protein